MEDKNELYQAFKRVQELNERVSTAKEPDYKQAYYDLFGTIILLIGFLFSFNHKK